MTEPTASRGGRLAAGFGHGRSPVEPRVPDSERFALAALQAAGERLPPSPTRARCWPPAWTRRDARGAREPGRARLPTGADRHGDENGIIEWSRSPTPIPPRWRWRRSPPVDIPRPRASTGVPNVLRTGRSELIERSHPSFSRGTGRRGTSPTSPDLQLRSAMVVPPRANDKVVARDLRVGVVRPALHAGRSWSSRRTSPPLHRRVENAALPARTGGAQRESDVRARLQISSKPEPRWRLLRGPGSCGHSPGGLAPHLRLQVAFVLGPRQHRRRRRRTPGRGALRRGRTDVARAPPGCGQRGHLAAE